MPNIVDWENKEQLQDVILKSKTYREVMLRLGIVQTSTNKYKQSYEIGLLY